jgi:hypothetical protein
MYLLKYCHKMNQTVKLYWFYDLIESCNVELFLPFDNMKFVRKQNTEKFENKIGL